MIDLNSREIATILAALRHWQHFLLENDITSLSPEHFAEGGNPLTVQEIDELCECLNSDERRTP